MLEHKYIPKSNRIKGSAQGKGNTIGIKYTDPFERERYYAWQKHRAQARYRKEDYLLTHEDWCALWPYDKFVCRGRGVNDLSMMRLDPYQPWRLDNVEVVVRQKYLDRAGEYRRYE